MSRPKGLPKTGGRKPGSINKKTTTFGAILEGLSFSIPAEAIKLFRENSDPLFQLDCLKFLASYTYPKPTDIRLTTETYNHDAAREAAKLTDDELDRSLSGGPDSETE